MQTVSAPHLKKRQPTYPVWPLNPYPLYEPPRLRQPNLANDAYKHKRRFEVSTIRYKVRPALRFGAFLSILIATFFLVFNTEARAVFRLNTARVLSAFVLALCVPLVLVGPMPFTFLGLFSVHFSGQSPVTLSELVWRFSTLFQEWPFWAFIFVALPVAYVFSSLIISGVQSRLVRVLLFGQVWLATYGRQYSFSDFIAW